MQCKIRKFLRIGVKMFNYYELQLLRIRYNPFKEEIAININFKIE